MYALTLAVASLGLAAGMVALGVGMQRQSVGILAVGAALFAVHVAAAWIPLSPRGWWVGVVFLGFGIFSCAMPAAIALLVFWLRPETKAAFRLL